MCDPDLNGSQIKLLVDLHQLEFKAGAIPEYVAEYYYLDSRLPTFVVLDRDHTITLIHRGETSLDILTAAINATLG